MQARIGFPYRRRRSPRWLLRASKTNCRRPAAPSSWRATRRSGRTSTRRSPPSSRTGATSRSRWRETAALFDQSHHMTDLYIEGPDAIRLLSDLGVNSFENFAVNKAKQFVCCNPDGYVIGDAILFYLDENRLSLVGRPSAHNWVQYHGETGDYDVTFDRDERTAVNPTGKRKLYRFQVQGPNAMQVLEKAVGAPLPGDQVLQHGRDHHRGPHGARAAPRHVRRARPRAVRPVGGRRGRARGDRRGGRGVRPEAGRLTRLRDEHARVRLDPVPAAGRVHGRRHEGVPRVAARERLRGDRIARRQLLLGRHLRLLPDPARPRVLGVRQVRPRLRRPRGARGDGRGGHRGAR